MDLRGFRARRDNTGRNRVGMCVMAESNDEVMSTDGEYRITIVAPKNGCNNLYVQKLAETLARAACSWRPEET